MCERRNVYKNPFSIARGLPVSVKRIGEFIRRQVALVSNRFTEVKPYTRLYTLTHAYTRYTRLHTLTMASVALSHSARHCYGNCAQHPLVDPTICRMMHTGARWGDILYVPMSEAQETEAVEYMRDIEKTCDSHKMKAYALMVERLKKDKVLKPCKWLYLNADGRTYSKHLTGAQCWAWEYVDPKTKKTEHPHTCKHCHPGEAEWHAAWDTDRYATHPASQVRSWI